MNNVNGIGALVWAAVWLVIVRQDAVTGAWFGVCSVVLAPVVLLMVLKRFGQPTAIHALEAEADVWCASVARDPGIAPSAAEAR